MENGNQMPMVGDEESAWGVNKPCKPEMDEEKLEIEGIQSTEESESILELGESSLIVGGERDGTMSLEDKPVATGGEEGVLENHMAAGESEFIVDTAAEMIEPPVVVAEKVVEEEGGSEMIGSQSEDPPLEMKAEEEAKGVDDAKGETAVTDTGDAPMLTESQVDTRGDELLVDPQLKMKDEGKIAPVDDSKLEMVVTDVVNPQPFSDLQMHARGDQMPVDPAPEMHGEEGFTPVVGAKVEVVVSDLGTVQNFSELQMDAREDGLQAEKEGMEVEADISERDMGSGEKVKEVGVVDNELVDSWAVGNNVEAIVEVDGVTEQKVDFVENDPEVAAGKSSGIELDKLDPLITDETPINQVNTDSEIKTAVNACVVHEQEQVHELSGVMEYVNSDVRYDQTEDKEVAPEASFMSETKMVEDESMSMEVLKDSKLDESVNVAENWEDAVVKEELSAGDIKIEAEAGAESGLTRNVLEEEVQSAEAEAEVETEKGTKVVADKIHEEDGKMETEETSSDVDEPVQDIYESPAAVQDEEDETMVAEEETGTQETEMETETDIAESAKTSAGKRKRGKLSKSPSISKGTAKASSRKTVGEDVCFICFDGGELVLCDRRGCPKAYHPSCVNRDEAFFKSKGRWNCGWHLCSICEKNARYMCYTCTFSLCKSCIKDAVILSVRGNKGFCETCMRTVMLIENNEQGNKDTQVDFDDRSSWEYLFKDYYIELKAKLSLTPVELREAKNPWKGVDMSGPSKQESSEAHADGNDGGSGSDDSTENVEPIRPKRRKVRKQSKSITKEEELGSTGASAGDKAMSLSDNSEWASRELLEFVSHMKNGDASPLSQFDVQALLLEYIKRNKLRDPRRKSQIICDARLENLFGKPRVGHFEMLKLLESHFLVRDEQNDDVQGSVVDTENNQLDIDGNADALTKGGKDRKRKSRRKSDRGPQSNLDDYAAIDMHNIGLIYMRRKLMEDLLEDSETFHDKVVGTFVRIRISGCNQKQDLYRLVQVVGTSKAAEPYKIGKKTTDTMVEILNLDKTEITSIDTISNQEFTEEECKRLRQSIKCGLISRLTVGEILDKTMELQAVRINDILKTPEERRRRLEEIPEIHADPKMDPSYGSDDNDSENEDSRQDAFMRSRASGFNRRRVPMSPGSDNAVKDSWSSAGKVSSKNWETSRNPSGNNFSINASHIGEIVNENSWNLERDKETQESNSNLEKLNSATNSESAEWALRPASRSESFTGVASVTSQASFSARVVETAVKINESEKMWHYQDPSGKVQGPFSMVQLRKWNNTGYFPADLRIWRTGEKQENSTLLADALAGKFPKELPAVDNTLPAANTLHSSHTLAGHSGKTSEISLHQDKETSIIDRNSASLSKLPTEKWLGNEMTNLPSPTPKQNNAGWTGGETGHLTGATGINGVLPSPTAVVPNIGTHSPAPASVLNSIVPTAPFSPTPNSQQGILAGSAVPLHTQSTMTSEPHAVQMHGHTPTSVQPVQTAITQNLQADPQSWSSPSQPAQPQNYGWGTSNVQNSSGSFSNSGMNPAPQPDVWRPTQSNQPNMHPPATPNVPWGMGPAENNASMGARPENPNIGWGTMQANPNMGWGNPVPGNTNMNWGPAMQAPPPGNTTPGWVAPAGNTGANIQGMVPGNTNPGWAATQGWVAPPAQGPVPGNSWVPPSGNAGPAPPAVQGPAQGNTNQGWVAAPPANQGSWGAEQNHASGQFSGQRGPQGRDSGFSGGRPWNRQSSFGGGGGGGGGGSRHISKRDMVCPYNANGRCKKGARCDYLHT
ncbi:Zinc finger CCCH domain-containing protein 19 [Sesamum alatum]|uniref:Zinc finger CCCH domain-containing protein 19 n=1 Tax=Sesamum alatum TaxID=300844 RepID=A0AAE1YVT9_9LAMI|nr:Zinc finger CCCH domain-containing protein 19 [Sesamum alatum]